MPHLAVNATQPGRPVRTASRRTALRHFIFTSDKALTFVVSLHLVYLPWAFGGVDLSSQLTSAVLGALALLLALRARRAERDPDMNLARSEAIRLFCEPLFWLGAAVLGYVALQACNPAYLHVREASRWWLQPLAHIRWLPAGMQVPFAFSGPWHTLLGWFGPWTLACALRIGVMRRAAVVTLLRVIVINGFVIAAFGMVQRAAGSEAIFGVRSAPSAAIFATFIYRNHAAAYLNLILTVAMLLGLAALRRPAGRETVREGAPLLYFLFAGTAFCAVVLSYSLAGVLLAVAGMFGLTVASFVRRSARRPAGTHGRPVAIGAIILTGIVGLVAMQAGTEQLQAKLGGTQALEQRQLAARQGVRMWQDRPLLGWGAGCFRYGFTKYQRAEPRISVVGGKGLFWEHQHNDWLELVIELGVLGLLPLLTAGFLWLRASWRAGVWHHPALVWGAGGLVILSLHAVIDFPLQNPAILATAVAVACLVLRWAETSPVRSAGGS